MEKVELCFLHLDGIRSVKVLLCMKILTSGLANKKYRKEKSSARINLR